MQLQSLSRRYTVRQLMETDVDAMLALCSGNPQFYRYHPPMATKASILDDLRLFRRAKRCRINILSAFMTVKRWPR